MQNVCSCLFSGSAQPQPLLQIFLIQITLARSLVNIHAPGLSLWDLLQSLWNSKKGKSHLTLEMFWVGTLPLWRLVRIVVALAPGPTSGAVGQNVDAWDILWNNNNIFSKFCQASIFCRYCFCLRYCLFRDVRSDTGLLSTLSSHCIGWRRSSKRLWSKISALLSSRRKRFFNL